MAIGPLPCVPMVGKDQYDDEDVMGDDGDVCCTLTVRRCPCVTSVSCNIVVIASTRTHVTTWQCATVSRCAHKLRILILYLVDNSIERRTGVVEYYLKGR